MANSTRSVLAASMKIKGLLASLSALVMLFAPDGSSGSPSITPPSNQSTGLGGSVNLSVAASGATGIQWQRNGASILGATNSTLVINNLQPQTTGLYAAVASDAGGSATSLPAVVGLDTNTKLVGPGTEFPDITAPNGNVYDQILLGGIAATVKPDPGQTLRISYVDINDDIVQVEMSGSGTLSIVLAAPSGPAAPIKYNQTTQYMKGHAGIVVTGATASTNLSVFSVGRANAANQALFQDVSYNGLADIAFIAIASADGQFGGLRAANARIYESQGYTGIFAPNVTFTGPVFVGDITANGSAIPCLIVGSGSDVRITGGSLAQNNNQPVRVKGITQLKFTAGSTSHGEIIGAHTNQAVLQQDGVDVTNLIVVNNTGAAAPPTGYTLAFADEFNGATLDTEQWQYRFDGKALSQQMPANVTVRDGLLHIAVKKQTANGFNYTGGGVISKRQFRYGYYEARIKSPSSPGWHSSFWSQAYNGANTDVQLAAQEVDFSEQDSSEQTSFTSNYYFWPQRKALGPFYYKGITPGMNTFHIIGGLFTPTRVVYYLDGVQYIPTIDLTNYPTHNDANIWLTSIATKQPTDQNLPDEFQVDWVHYYAPPEGAQPATPRGVTTISGLDGRVELDWDPSVGAVTYSIKRSSTPGGPYSTIASVPNTSYIDPQAVNGMVFYYVVSALSTTGLESNDSNEIQGSAGAVEVIKDNLNQFGVVTVGDWVSSSFNSGYYGSDYVHDGNSGTAGGKSVTFTPTIPKAGSYAVYLNWPAAANRASNTPIDVYDGTNITSSRINQQQDGTWRLIGTFHLDAGESSYLRIRNDGANGYVIADAVKWVLQ